MRQIHTTVLAALICMVALLGATRAWGIGQGKLGTRACHCVTPEQRRILDRMRLVVADDGTGTLVETIQFTGVNVQIVNGLNDTETANGTGNLIVGYNTDVPGYCEPGLDLPAGPPAVHTGSHNVIVGDGHTYSSHGGLLAGFKNSVTAPFASVSGGQCNTAGAMAASVSGGSGNSATGMASSVSGGGSNSAEALQASVSGGGSNTASGPTSSVSGGVFNTASGPGSSACGGQDNEAAALASSVSGGLSRTAQGQHDWAAGQLLEDE